jgi:DNA-directed RNA polymerase subunit RPC12/RpoP
MEKCYKCGKEVEKKDLNKADMDGRERLVCSECITKLKRLWVDWYAK